MTTFEADRLHASDATRTARAAHIAQTFDLYLRGASPALASTFGMAQGSLPLATTVISAILEVADRTQAGAGTTEFDRLRLIARGSPRSDAIVGHALIAALQETLGPAFDEATREAWANGYVRLVETVMAARRNRMDCVA